MEEYVEKINTLSTEMYRLFLNNLGKIENTKFYDVQNELGKIWYEFQDWCKNSNVPFPASRLGPTLN